MALQAGDVGADRDVASVLGAALADLEPAAVGEFRLEGAGGGRARLGQLAADLRQHAPAHHLAVAAARLRVFRVERVQVPELRIAQHQPVGGVPEDEGLRDRLDRVAQAHVGGGAALGEVVLLAHVDGDADEMVAAIGGIRHHLGAGAQPDIGAVGAAHAEGVVDDGLVGGEPPREAVEVAVVGMDEGVHLAEGEILVLALVAEQGVHRVRPVDPPARDVPVPQAAAAAAERDVEALADLLADPVRPLGAAALQAVGEADADDDEGGGADQHDLVAGAGMPAPEQRLQGLHHRDPPPVRQTVHGGDERLAVRGRQLGRAEALAEGGQRLAIPEQPGEARRVPVERRMGGEDALLGGDQDQAAAVAGGGLGGQAAEVALVAGPRRRGRAGEDLDLGGGGGDDLVALAADVQRRDADEAGEEGREQRRDRVAEGRLGPDQAGIPCPRGPVDTENRARTRGEGSGSRLRHERTSTVGRLPCREAPRAAPNLYAI
ncbi:hypothetical protein IFDJLNFL_5624 [Methylobacterium dankookense]|uniref:Uncharacterized protein n=1 Tax=Methylobacterium dankookense TaxID=560405 RepID=A0ABQ4RPG3_9HYPH|nr:hypothetical protein IFDJLNFL_5624 [Methylobacterium dankookense]